MSEYGVQAYTQDARGVPASRAIHCHIDNGLMSIRFGSVVAKVELEGFQAIFTAIALGPGRRMPVTSDAAGFVASRADYINLCHISYPKAKA